RRSDREYDVRMRKPPITFDAILAALAVLSTTAACSKAERAASEPASATPPAVTATASATAPVAQPAAPPPAAPTAAAPLDAGVERSPSPKPTKGGSAACGATGCSAEMRKGGK
ncbi:MAG TPA: hypothetical protein VM052_06815, partial [Candidatus Limnocylindrales bacterium]|nr:hypothetical protein [Candidatus Limnocylindrales bacterium]